MAWACLAFFLAAFQVHEKSLLLALVPASLLVLHKPLGEYDARLDMTGQP